MTKEEIEKYKNEFKETDAYKWFTNLSEENKTKLKLRHLDSCAIVHGELIISIRGIKELHKRYSK